jgi:CDP-glucose 4,6-dehydratase
MIQNNPGICFGDVYRGRTVLVTGHTGFKGSWLCFWLRELGANVVGFALPPATDPNHFDLLRLPISSVIGDVRDLSVVHQTLSTHQPEIVFHLAAQPLVRRSYREPLETFNTNVIGTANLLHSCRSMPSVRALVNVTSDKVYENVESITGYRETDRLGGIDPYSCSKACSELLTQCFRESYFPEQGYGREHGLLIASLRAGNVIGGGDWSEDRLIPDAVKAAVDDRPVVIRNPNSVRPWQHVLEPLSGYLLTGSHLIQGKVKAASTWNFGPDEESNVQVAVVLNEMTRSWPAVRPDDQVIVSGPHETKVLRLDSSKAKKLLGWRPVWSWRQALARTTSWYRAYYESRGLSTADDLTSYLAAAREMRQGWIES